MCSLPRWRSRRRDPRTAAVDSAHFPGGWAPRSSSTTSEPKVHDPAELIGVDPATYGLRRPHPAPPDLGYHEVFHLLVIAGVAAPLWGHRRFRPAHQLNATVWGLVPEVAA
jgi:hypothetical protein